MELHTFARWSSCICAHCHIWSGSVPAIKAPQGGRLEQGCTVCWVHSLLVWRPGKLTAARARRGGDGSDGSEVRIQLVLTLGIQSMEVGKRLAVWRCLGNLKRRNGARC